MIRKITLLIIVSLFCHNIYSAIYYSINDGNWSTASNWSGTSGGSASSKAPAKGDDVHIEGHDIILDVDLSDNPGIELIITLDGSLTSSGTQGVLIATNGDLDISSGTVDVYTVDLKNGAIVNVGASGTLISDQWVANNATITVDGTMQVGTYLDNAGTISGNGTITAAQYLGAGSVFGITPTSSIADGSTVGGWTWSGSTNTDWGTASNWAIASVPTQTSNVVIMSGGNQPIINTTAATNNVIINSSATLDIIETYSLTINGDLSNSGTLTIKSSSSGTGSLLVNGTSTGNIVVERYLTDGAWHLISPTTSGVTANNFYWSESPSAWLTYHTETTNDWTYNTSLSTSMPIGQGWSVWLDNGSKTSATATMTGTIQISDLTASLSYSGSGDNQGWNLLGNPYATAIDWDNGTWGSNTTGTVYVWDNGYNSGDYRSWNGSEGDLTNGVIPMGQGFFVKSSSAGDFVIPSGARVISSTDIYKQGNDMSNNQYMRFQLDMENHGNTLFIGFPENGTSEFDYKGDATKLYSNSDMPQLYTIEKGSKLCINANEPLINDTKTIPLYIDQVVDGDYSLTSSQLENLPDVNVSLEDIKTGVFQNLNTRPIYEFTAIEGDDKHRFNVHFSSSPSSISRMEINNKDVHIYGANNTINIYSKGEESKTGGVLRVYNLNGQLIKKQDVGYGKLIKIPVNTSERILIVKLHKQGSVIVEKVVIK